MSEPGGGPWVEIGSRKVVEKGQPRGGYAGLVGLCEVATLLAEVGVAQRSGVGAWAYARSMAQRSLNEACYDTGALLWDLDADAATVKFCPVFSGYDGVFLWLLREPA